MVATYAVGGAKKDKLPAPLRIPRPTPLAALQAQEQRVPEREPMTRHSIRNLLLTG